MAFRLPPLAALRAFEAAGRHLSFKQAAQELHVTPAAISQQVKALEEHLGFPLFRRLTRAVELTEQGATLLPRIREGFECLASAVEASRMPVRPMLRITAPPSFATRWLVPRLPGFLAAHPEVDLRLASSADAVDNAGSGPVVAQAQDADGHCEVAIRYGTGHYPGYRVQRLFTPEYLPVCSPALLRAGPPLATPADLARHRLIHDETIRDEGRQPNWAGWMRAAGVTGIDTRRGPRFSNAELAVQAALDGQGVALAMQPLVALDIEAGRLVVPFDIAVQSPHAYFLVAQEGMARREPVAAFREWLLAQFRQGVPPGPAAGAGAPAGRRPRHGA